MKCIYRITHVPSGRFYIGSTLNYERRKQRHLKDLESGKHHCAYLQRLWKKSISSDFSIEIVEELTSDCLLLPREQHYLDLGFKAGLCLNVCKTAGNCMGVKQSESTKEKRAALLRGTKRTPEQCRRISEARKRVGITPDHQKLLNHLSAQRAFCLSYSLAEEIKSRRMNHGESLESIAEKLGITIKPLRRELLKHFGKIKWPSIKVHEHQRGDRHPMAKLSEQDARAIIATRAKAKDIANKYGVTLACVYDIRYGRSWKHLPR